MFFWINMNPMDLFLNGAEKGWLLSWHGGCCGSTGGTESPYCRRGFPTNIFSNKKRKITNKRVFSQHLFQQQKTKKTFYFFFKQHNLQNKKQKKNNLYILQRKKENQACIFSNQIPELISKAIIPDHSHSVGLHCVK